MSAMTLEYPSHWLAVMGLEPEDFAQEARTAAAMKLFERGRFSSGQAAQFAGMSRTEFLLSCHRWGVPSVQWDDAELEAEFSSQMAPSMSFGVRQRAASDANLRRPVLPLSSRPCPLPPAPC